MSDPYNTHQQYLKQLHQDFTTPQEIINSAVGEATGLIITKQQRIISGESNEVYEITLSDHTLLILRISHAGNEVFLREKFVMEVCLSKEIPVPKILFIKDYTLDGKTYSFSIQERVCGDPLERGQIDYRKFDKDRLRKIMNKAGLILSRIHTIPTEGFGYLDENGKGEFRSWNEMVSEHLAQESIYMNVAENSDFGTENMKKIFSILQKESEKVQNYIPVLNHNDFGPKHIMVKGDEITGIIDWGEAAGNIPAYDFIAYSFWYTDIPLEWLKEGYENKNIFIGEFNQQLLLLSIYKSLGILWWYYEKKYREGISIITPRITKVLQEYNSFN